MFIHVFNTLIYDRQIDMYNVMGEGWGFPGSQRHFICMDMENVDFTLCFTVFYAFL